MSQALNFFFSPFEMEKFSSSKNFLPHSLPSIQFTWASFGLRLNVKVSGGVS